MRSSSPGRDCPTAGCHLWAISACAEAEDKGGIAPRIGHLAMANRWPDTSAVRGAQTGEASLTQVWQPKVEAQTPLSRHTRASEEQAVNEDARSPHHAFGSGEELHFVR